MATLSSAPGSTLVQIGSRLPPPENRGRCRAGCVFPCANRERSVEVSSHPALPPYEIVPKNLFCGTKGQAATSEKNCSRQRSRGGVDKKTVKRKETYRRFRKGGFRHKRAKEVPAVVRHTAEIGSREGPCKGHPLSFSPASSGARARLQEQTRVGHPKSDC